MTVVSGVVGVMASGVYEESKWLTVEQAYVYPVPQWWMNEVVDLSGSGHKVPTDEELLAHPNWKFRDQYDAVYEFSDGVAKVIKDWKEWVINLKGEMVVNLGEYETIKQIFEEWIIVKKEANWLINDCEILDLQWKKSINLNWSLDVQPIRTECIFSFSMSKIINFQL